MQDKTQIDENVQFEKWPVGKDESTGYSVAGCYLAKF